MTDGARPRTLFRAAAAVTSALVVYVLCEAGLRLALGDRFVPEPPPRRVEAVLGRYDPDLGWALTPSGRSRVYADGCSYGVALNARGFRDAERGPRAAGTRRIVLLGDSYGFGWGVEQTETFGALLERDARVGAEVANLCIPGYSTDQELWTFEREGERLAPDLVLLEFCPNDVDSNETTLSHRMPKPQFFESGAGNWIVLNRPVTTFAPIGGRALTWGERSMSWSAVWQVVSGRTPLVARDGMVPRASDRPAREDPFERASPTRHALEMLAARCRGAGARLVVFGVPAIDQPGLAAAGGGDGEFLYELNRGLARCGREAGFTTLSVDRAFRDAHRAGRVLTVPDGHWNAEGHRLAAEALAPQIGAFLRASCVK